MKRVYNGSRKGKIHMVVIGSIFKLCEGERKKKWWMVWVQTKDQCSEVDENQTGT